MTLDFRTTACNRCAFKWYDGILTPNQRGISQFRCGDLWSWPDQLSSWIQSPPLCHKNFHLKQSSPLSPHFSQWWNHVFLYLFWGNATINSWVNSCFESSRVPLGGFRQQDMLLNYCQCWLNNWNNEERWGEWRMKLQNDTVDKFNHLGYVPSLKLT